MKQKNTKRLLDFFGTLSDETRLEILLSLVEKPKTVGDIHTALGKDKLTLSAVSHQLKQMADLDIVQAEKKGREKTFSLSDQFCWCILKDALSHYNNEHDSTTCPACRKARGARVR